MNGRQHQVSEYLKSDEMKEAKKSNFWWPDVSTPERARSAAMGGATVAAIVAVVTTGVALYTALKGPALGMDPWSFLDGALFAIIAFGIWRLSRAAAVGGLVLYLIERAVQIATTGVRGPLLAIFFILFLVNAIRGTFSYHRLAREARDAAPPLAP